MLLIEDGESVPLITRQVIASANVVAAAEDTTTTDITVEGNTAVHDDVVLRDQAEVGAAVGGVDIAPSAATAGIGITDIVALSIDDDLEESYDAILEMARTLEVPMGPIVLYANIPKSRQGFVKLIKNMWIFVLLDGEWELAKLVGSDTPLQGDHGWRYRLYTSDEYGCTHLLPECYGKNGDEETTDETEETDTSKPTRWLLLTQIV